MKRAAIVVVSGLLAAGCMVVTGCRPEIGSKSASSPATPATAESKPIFDPSLPPSRKEVLRVLLRNQGIALSSSPTCSGVGTSPKDTDLGDYLSGFLAEQDSPHGGNWIEVTSKPEAGADNPRLWHNNVVIRHANGEDVWGWGVSFVMRGDDHSFVAGSVSCTGAG